MRPHRARKGGLTYLSPSCDSTGKGGIGTPNCARFALKRLRPLACFNEVHEGVSEVRGHEFHTYAAGCLRAEIGDPAGRGPVFPATHAGVVDSDSLLLSLLHRERQVIDKEPQVMHTFSTLV